MPPEWVPPEWVPPEWVRAALQGLAEASGRQQVVKRLEQEL
jgi:hypothetical protein